MLSTDSCPHVLAVEDALYRDNRWLVPLYDLVDTVVDGLESRADFLSRICADDSAFDQLAWVPARWFHDTEAGNGCAGIDSQHANVHPPTADNVS
jgi:hypothetical protein